MGATKGIAVAQRARRGLDEERIIASALIDVASELRLTDVVELINLIRNDQEANLADLINSSTELFYRSGTLRYALSATFNAPWNATPSGRARHGVLSSKRVRLLPVDDRRETGGNRDHRHPVRRAGAGRGGEARTPGRRVRKRPQAEGIRFAGCLVSRRAAAPRRSQHWPPARSNPCPIAAQPASTCDASAAFAMMRKAYSIA